MIDFSSTLNYFENRTKETKIKITICHILYSTISFLSSIGSIPHQSSLCSEKQHLAFIFINMLLTCITAPSFQCCCVIFPIISSYYFSVFLKRILIFIYSSIINFYIKSIYWISKEVLILCLVYSTLHSFSFLIFHTNLSWFWVTFFYVHFKFLSWWWKS